MASRSFDKTGKKCFPWQKGLVERECCVVKGFNEI